MQRLGDRFIILKMATAQAPNGEDLVVCQLPDSAWVLGQNEHAPYVTSLEQVQHFDPQTREEVRQWLSTRNGTAPVPQQAPSPQPSQPRTPAEALTPSQVAQQQTANRLASIVQAMSPAQQAETLQILESALAPHQDALAQAQQTPDLSGQVVEVPADISPEQRAAIEASGGLAKIDPATGLLVWNPAENAPAPYLDEQGNLHNDIRDPEQGSSVDAYQRPTDAQAAELPA